VLLQLSLNLNWIDFWSKPCNGLTLIAKFLMNHLK